MEFLNPKIHIQQMLWEKKLREANKTSSYEISGDFFYRNKVTSDNNKVHIFTIYTKQQISHEELQKGPIAQCSIDIYRDNLAVISNISVLDDYRGKGIGREVYERAVRKARSFGGKNFYSHQELHENAIKIQEKLFPENYYFNEKNQLILEGEAIDRIRDRKYVTWSTLQSPLLNYLPEREVDLKKYLRNILGRDQSSAIILTKARLGMKLNENEEQALKTIYENFDQKYVKSIQEVFAINQ